MRNSPTPVDGHETAHSASGPRAEIGREMVYMCPSGRTIIELNITRYRELLKYETEPTKRHTIATLLAEEEAKLTSLATGKIDTTRDSK
jgi:hypothetical protein